MRGILTRWLGLAVLAGVALGCSSAKSFQITSFPAGAKIYVDSAEKGTTDRQVVVDFADREFATVRIEYEGFQPVGQVISLDTPSLLYFVLQKSPEPLR
ncbi:MAG: PEGA domain-containing protein [Planctomycetota bacterium]